MNGVLTALLWLGVLGSGVIGGVFFAFSTFIMPAFSRIEPAQGVAAMNSINATILGSVFMPVFFGTAIGSVILGVAAVFRWGEPGTAAALTAGSCYVLGVLVTTIVFNVPLNNALAAVDAADADNTPMWPRYLSEWVFWNHVRTAASTAACALFVLALVGR